MCEKHIEALTLMYILMIRYFMKFISFIYILLLFTTAECQQRKFGKLHLETVVAKHLEENSGIALSSNPSILYGVNDSGGTNQVFGFDIRSGKIKQIITIANAKNKDWEDLAIEEDVLYIGDVGNNENDRNDQIIYWVENISSYNDKTNTAFAKSTSFILEDQEKYPPKKKNFNFDIESFFVYKDHFYLFTRNRSKDFDGTTKLYRLPKKTGFHTAVHIDSFKTCSDQDDCQITSATIDPTTGKIALLSYNKVWILEKYPEDYFFKGTITKIKLEHTSQKESICFKNKNTLYIAEEGTSKKGGKLFTLSLKE